MRSPAPESAAELRVIELDDDEFPEVTVTIRRHPRTRHVRLHVDESGTVTASIPTRYRVDRIDEIVRERAEWLREAIERVDLLSRNSEVDLERGDPVRFLGSWYPVNIAQGRSGGEIVDGRLQLRVPVGADPYDTLERWYRSRAREIIEQRVAIWAQYLGLEFGAISIRDQRTRWGSCTHKGDLSFNWRLVLAPPWVLDSIIVHELCHIEELNHSDRFWALLDERYPQHEAASEWLATHGGALRMMRRVRRASDDLPPVRPRRGRKVSADNLRML